MTQTTLPQTLARMDGERMRAYRDNLSFYQGDQWRAAPVTASVDSPSTTPRPSWKRLPPT